MMNKENSIIVSTACAVGRFARGVIGVGTLGLSEVAIAAGKGVKSLFKKEEEDYFDEDDFDEFFEEEDFREVKPVVYECTAEDLKEAADAVEQQAEAESPKKEQKKPNQKQKTEEQETK